MTSISLSTTRKKDCPMDQGKKGEAPESFSHRETNCNNDDDSSNVYRHLSYGCIVSHRERVPGR